MSQSGLGDGCSGVRPENETLSMGRRPRARDIMISHPKSLPADATVDDARAALADDHVHMVLLGDGETLCGTLVRADLPGAGLTGSEPAFAWAVLRGRTVRPETTTERVLELLSGNGLRRLAVIDANRTLLGLVCLKRSRAGFCSDADVASRAAAIRTTVGGTT